LVPTGLPLKKKVNLAFSSQHSWVRSKELILGMQEGSLRAGLAPAGKADRELILVIAVTVDPGVD
jgi:hypothetical protein